MQIDVKIKDLGLIDYKEAWDYQERLFNELLGQKNNKDSIKYEVNKYNNYLIFCEHPNVYTMGKSGSMDNLLINKQFLGKINAKFYKTNRGGDITYHGPGQLVAYPVLNLEHFKIGIKQYIFNIEKSIIVTLKKYGLYAFHIEGITGVWVRNPHFPDARKICAIGVRASRSITMHGFALNINTDLEYFKYINPCGFVNKDVTSVRKELGRIVNFDDVKNELQKNIAKIFNINLL